MGTTYLQPLGNCQKCGNKLAVCQRNKFRLVGDHKILLDEQGKDVSQAPGGQLSGRPAVEWLVICPDCGREARDHPHQKLLDEAAARRKAEEKAALEPVSTARLQYTEVNAVDALDRRNRELQGQIDGLSAELATLREQLAAAPPRKGR